MPLEAIAEANDGPHSRTQRMLSALGRASIISNAAAAWRDDLDLHERRCRNAVEETIAAAPAVGAVIRPLAWRTAQIILNENGDVGQK